MWVSGPDSSETLSQISRRLREVFGMQLDPEGRQIASAVGTRTEALGLDPVGYRDLLIGPDSADELLNLAGQLPLGPTAFDTDHLLQISQLFFQPLLRSRLANKPEGAKPSLSIWSVGCGCGQEVYSVLSQLAQLTNLSAWDLRVLATDISQSRLAQARSRMPHQFRCVVDLRVHNILSPQMPADAPEKFNLVFCRAMLEQLYPRAKTDVLGKLARALSPDGLLVLSETESSGLDHPLLQPAREEFGFVLCRRLARQAQPIADVPTPPPTPMLPPLRSKLRRIFLPTSFGTAPRRTKPTLLVDDRTMAAQFLQRAQQLADDFQFPQALLVARRAAQLDKFNLAAHFTTGVIARRMDRLDEAIEAFERVCYLDKNLVMAHFLLGHIYQETHRTSLARHHYDRALEIIADEPAEKVLLFSDGVSAGLLRDLCLAGKDALAQVQRG